MKNYIQSAASISTVATAAVSSGAGVQTGVLFGVAKNAAAIGDPLELLLEGQINLPKVEAQAWAVGEAVFWDDVNSRCSNVSVAGLLLIGCVASVATNPSTTGDVRLNGAVPAAIQA